MSGEMENQPSDLDRRRAEPADGGDGGPKRSADEIQEWMVNHLAEALSISPDTIDVTAPFDEFGLDSPSAVGMTGDLEDWLGKRVDPTLIFDYPTIEQFSQRLGDGD
jgi:acyl carrier protein